jgi:hypothetical protein
MTTRLLSLLFSFVFMFGTATADAATIRSKPLTPRLGVDLDAAKVRADIRAKQRSGSVKAYSTGSKSGVRCSVTDYKKVRRFQLPAGEIPQTWSWYMGGDIGPVTSADMFYKGIFFSIAQEGVAFGDTNWNQVDIGKVTAAGVRSWVQDWKSEKDLGSWTQIDIDGRKADVLTFPLGKNDEVTKATTGGKYYFLAWSDTTSDGKSVEMGLVIHKQAKGDLDFECGTDHFIETMDLDPFVKAYAGEFVK